MTLESAGQIDGVVSSVATDIGGRPTPNGWLRRGLLYRLSGALQGPGAVAGLGLRIVVDLRGADEDREQLVGWAAEQLVSYRHFPISVGDPNRIIAELSQAARSSEAAVGYLCSIYLRMLNEHGAAFAGAVGAMSNRLPAGFGCAVGKDRTGLLAALLQETAGVERADVVADYLAHAPKADQVQTMVRETLPTTDLEDSALDVLFGASEEVIRAALGHVSDRWGGASAYLEAHGISKLRLQRLRERLVEPTP
jgi:protein-tyrosine phosphatase